ncbi:EscU/YscU/HrcU family type III secretion system export apparatus switch protein [Pseudokordiimonas caeni]|uniref:EscU/YscU/HrcU family type III secretion system export apparatus switch protein n=1 Tax=Pseudokordiimonas caeni TaxID=2997908 RepID=UPI002811A4C1|nr:EscU/YscU/HrcU family type III secretion system export apparatus switch protein [Pseudokordiimonas caeni]
MQEADQLKTPSTKAVAIDGERASGGTPKIVAKGKGFNAERILDIAFAEGVKVRQDSELTDILEQFEVESPVPLEALHAVSLILDRVYQENRRLAGEPEDNPPAGTTMPAQDKGQS